MISIDLRHRFLSITGNYLWNIIFERWLTYYTSNPWLMLGQNIFKSFFLYDFLAS